MTPYDHDHNAPEARETTPAPSRQQGTGHAIATTPERARLIRGITIWGGAATVLLLVIGIAHHVLDHNAAMATLKAQHEAIPLVRVEPVKTTTTPRDLSLPGTMSAFELATIYARQSGYVSERRVDIGSKVKAGDLLAIIAAPELDDQLAQARAQLGQMQAALKQVGANRALAAATDQRTEKLVEQGWQSRQQGDTDRLNLQAQVAAVGVADANLKAQQAQVERLEKEQAYERVVAPFDGVVTQRSVDIGSLVTADSTTGTSMFTIARTNVLRVQVYVPQDAALGLKPGIVANVSVSEMPGRVFTGHVARTAEALQAGTRTLLAEIDVENPDGTLAAGMYCTVAFQVPRANPVMAIPAEALIFNRDGTQVAIYEDGKAHIRKVALAEDDGDHVDIADGLNPGDQVIVSLPVDLTDGAAVQIRNVKREADASKVH
jgi:RND family efflux transporter MFP subunit